MTPDRRALEAAFAHNRDLPSGRTRNAHAEQLVEEAEQLGDEAMLTEALLNLIDAYEYSAERDKMLVPFARALRRFDAHPEHYDDGDARVLFWSFKWVSSGMIAHPGVGLDAIENWLREMAQRYRQHGHSLDPVHKSELIIAMHLGDTERAERAHRLWRQTERDSLSDCLACDLVRQGWFHLDRDDDAAAIESWRPVLDGDRGCKEQPHSVLGDSLLPLSRLGRVEEARANHLRGYRLARHNESLLSTVGQHIEFCALTGNEARGLELLAEHAKYLGGVFDQLTTSSFQTSAAVLMRRLIDGGRGGQSVPGPPDRDWTAAEAHAELERRVFAIVARFDARNGNTAVSDRVRSRLEREPLSPVRLGTSSRALPSVPVAARPPVVTEPVDLDAAITEASALTERGDPRATAAWLAVAAAAESRGEEPEALVRGEILRHRFYAVDGPEQLERGDLLREAADCFDKAQRPDKAQLCLIMAARLDLHRGHDEEAHAQTEAALTTIERLYADGEAAARERFQVNAEARRSRILQLARAEAPVDEFAAVDTALVELDRQAADHPEADRLLPQRAYIALIRVDVAEHRDDVDAAIALLRDCLRWLREAGRVSRLRFPSLRLAMALLHVERSGEAREVIEAALATPDPEPDAAINAQLCWQLAQLLLGGGEWAPALDLALRASDWYEQCDNPAAAAFNNYLAARAHLGLGQPFEAATILETALPPLTETEPQAAVDARFQLIGALMAIGEYRDAARHALTGLESVKDDDQPYVPARYASLAAQALERDGQNTQAVSAYLAAARLWHDLGEWGGHADMIRRRALLRTRVDSHDAASGELDALVTALTTARGEAEPRRRPLLDRELALVEQTRALALSTHLDDNDDFDRAKRRAVVAIAEAAVAGLAALGPDCLPERLSVDRQLVFYLAEAEDVTGAVDHARAAERRCREAGDEFAPHAADFAALAEQYRP